MATSPQRTAVIALGSNLGDSRTTLEAAAARIATTPGIELTALSIIYTSLPAVVLDQPLFKNAVALIKTELSPLDLLHTLQSLEKEFGRVREGAAYIPSGPRTLDLDIIDVEGVVMNDAELTLPHPEALYRAFVVVPLLEISPHHVLANQKVVNLGAVDCGDIVPESDAEHLSTDAQQKGEYPASEGEYSADSRDPQGSGEAPGGRLFICATPIGNLGDITLRVLETLRSADLIYCEDTRITRKLTAHYEISVPLKRADAHTLPRLLPNILAQLEEGQRLAYVSDAGMPGISDPGGLLVAAVREAGYAVEVLPGASALTTALAASGIKAHNHYFGGYFPRKVGAGTRLLETVAQLDDTVLVFYESIHRVVKTVQLIASLFPDRHVVMARELTKLHEEIASGTAEELAHSLVERSENGRTLKGEVVLLIAPHL